jgi:hypothetical protein
MHFLNLFMVGEGEIMFVLLSFVFSLAFLFFDGTLLIQIRVLLYSREKVKDFARLFIWDILKFRRFCKFLSFMRPIGNYDGRGC